MKGRALFLMVILFLAILSIINFPANVKAQEEGRIEVSSPTFSQFSVLEIKVYDPDIAYPDNPLAAMPTVRVKTGYHVYTVSMYQSTEGYWFGYIRVWSWIDSNGNGLWDSDEPIIIDLDQSGTCTTGDFNYT
ncbi:hypothetical protein DRO51_03925, partial [Candidatus Bathyarchaeota archaeon]